MLQMLWKLQISTQETNHVFWDFQYKLLTFLLMSKDEHVAISICDQGLKLRSIK
jgi:hypothetical protein